MSSTDTARRDRQTMLHNRAKDDAPCGLRDGLRRREEMHRLFSCLPLRGNKAFLFVSRGKSDALPILRGYADKEATFAVLDESLLFTPSSPKEGCAIPLPDASVDMAFVLSPTLRQEAHPDAARDLYRVLRPGRLAYVLRFAPSLSDALSEEPPAPSAPACAARMRELFLEAGFTTATATEGPGRFYFCAMK